MILGLAYRWFEAPHRLKAISSALGRAPSNILDVGCGNHSPSVTKKYFPDVLYHGIDNSEWNNTSADLAKIDQLYAIDLEDVRALDEAIPNRSYEAIVCSHVLEHLAAPYDTLKILANKLRPAGVLYVEAPAERSLLLPSARRSFFGIHGCLNFYDDPTHKTLIDMRRAEDVIRSQGLFPIRIGPRRMLRRVVLLPCYVLAGVLTRGYIPASVVWDVAGFANCLVARR